MDGSLPFLPKEIITNILQHLPVKSLIRFQCVCKDWKNLIKSPSFVEEHLHRSTRQGPSLLINQRHDTFHLCVINCKMEFREFDDSPPFFSSSHRVRIVGSSNGLLCFADRSAHPPSPLLWNPATREVRHVPITSDHFRAHRCFSSDLRFAFVFGFSPFINDYKIVMLAFVFGVEEVQVYSLNRGSWRNIQFDNMEDVYILGDGVTINGTMFWHGFKLNGSSWLSLITYVMVSFDLVSEVFTVRPSSFAFRRSSLEIVTPSFAALLYSGAEGYEEKLAVLSRPEIINSQYSYIYLSVMEEGLMGSSGERWSSSRRYIRSSHPSKLHAMTIWRNQIVCVDFAVPKFIGEAEGEMENVEPKLGLYMINVTTDERKLFTIPRRGPHHYSVDIVNYVESLVPLGNIQH